MVMVHGAPPCGIWTLHAIRGCGGENPLRRRFRGAVLRLVEREMGDTGVDVSGEG